MTCANPHFWQLHKDIIVGTIHISIANEAMYQKVLAKVNKIFTKKGVKNLTVEVSVLDKATPLL